jgi:hypothetical protein
LEEATPMGSLFRFGSSAEVPVASSKIETRLLSLRMRAVFDAVTW